MFNKASADFHMHTTASDGVLSPAELVRYAKQRGVTVMAVTDHDTVHGLREARAEAARQGITLIGGVELSADHDASVHVLGYGVSEEDAELEEALSVYRDKRAQRMRNMLDKLKAIQLPVPEEELCVKSQDALSRPHLARAMVRRGYAANSVDAFERFLRRGRPAYVQRHKLSVPDAVALLKRAGAVPVIAHPGQIRLGRSDFLRAFEQWLQAGIMGLEAFHPSHTKEEQAFYHALAKEHGLLTTGGSDFHEKAPLGSKHGEPGQMIAAWQSLSADYQQDIQTILQHR